MKRSEEVTFTNMCMIYDEKNNVLVQDKKDEDFKGITFPGGHVEKGEPFTDAVIREVYEETGLKISSPKLCGIKNWTNDDGSRYVVLLYKTDRFTGELKSSEEGEVFWVSLSDMQDMKLAYDMDKMLRVFLEDEISEFHYLREGGSWIAELK